MPLPLLPAGPSNMPPGFRYLDDFLDKEETSDLFEQLKTLDWNGRGGFIRYGRVVLRKELDYIHSYGRGRSDRGPYGPAEALPKFLEPVVKRVHELMQPMVPSGYFDQLIAAYYPAGAAIARHIDDQKEFDDVIVGVSLQPGDSPARMLFYPKDDSSSTGKQILASGSLYVLSDDARHAFEHRVPKVRSTRFSPTLRRLLRCTCCPERPGQGTSPAPGRLGVQQQAAVRGQEK